MTRFLACFVVVVALLLPTKVFAGVFLLESDRSIGGGSDLLRWNCASPFTCVDYIQHPYGVQALDDAPWIESQDDFVEFAELGAFAHNVGSQNSSIDLAALVFGGEGSVGSETAASDSTVFPWGYGIGSAGSGYSVTLRLTEFNYEFDIQALLEATQAGVYGQSLTGVSLTRLKGLHEISLVGELICASLVETHDCLGLSGNASRTVTASGILTPGVYRFAVFAGAGGGVRPNWGLTFDDSVTSTAKWNGQLALTQGDRAVPEPGLMALAATALASLWIRRRAGPRTPPPPASS